MEIVTKCGIATKARAENTIGHYITDRDHIVLSAEQSLRNLATDHLDLLLIHRPDPLMDADEVAEAFLALHHSGKGSSLRRIELYPRPVYPAAVAPAIYPGDQPGGNFSGPSAAAADGTLDQLQQLRIRPMAWSCLGGGRLFNDDSFQPLRDELARVAPGAECGEH